MPTAVPGTDRGPSVPAGDPLDDLPPPALAGYGEAEVAFARDAWPLRAAEELRSALIFRALAQASARSPICASWAARFLAAAHDEIFHAKLCAATGARLGAPP